MIIRTPDWPQRTFEDHTYQTAGAWMLLMYGGMSMVGDAINGTSDDSGDTGGCGWGGAGEGRGGVGAGTARVGRGGER